MSRKKAKKNNEKSLKSGALKIQRTLFFVLLIIVIILAAFSIAKAKGLLIKAQPAPPVVLNKISLDALTLEQKIAQMVIAAGQKWDMSAWKKMQLGGIHLYAKANKSIFSDTVQQFQESMVIPFFVSVDLEGCQNPFAAFRNFTAAVDVTTTNQALEKGLEEGEFLSSLGITVNFAPVVDLEDAIWKCRSFPGEAEQVAALAEAYVSGLQEEDVLATAKHYPGKTLVVRDPHKFLVAAFISADDVFPYQKLAASTPAIMISHVISSGEVNSRGAPAAASPEAVQKLREKFEGLIITDEINMLGLKKFYPTLDAMYLAVFNAGSDLILNFNEDPQEIQRMISVVKKAVLTGEIKEERIDASVRRILAAKGFIVE